VKGLIAVAILAATPAACSPESARNVAAPPKLMLALRGTDLAPLSLAEMKKLGDAKIVVSDPHEHARVEMRAVPVDKVFDAAFGPAWRTEEEVVVTCADGLRPAIPVSLFLEREAYFAYARTDAPDFAVQEDPSKRTPVGPYYVVWPPRRSSILQRHARRAGNIDPPDAQWPYQVTAVEVTDYATRFAANVPPPEADAIAKRGFETFRTICLPCHAVNGRGGSVGPELNYPVNVTEYFAEPVLRKLIDDPQKVRHGAKMPRPLPSLEDEGPVIDELVAYLQVMARKKVPPP
jgi:mono/diheme cytochrome c family protein